MKKSLTTFIFLAFLMVPALTFGQLKKDLVKPDISESLTKPAGNYLLGIFDPSRMQMSHSFSMGLSTGGSNSIFYNTYMNMIDFKLSEKLFLKTRIGIMNSPYHTLGENSMFDKPIFFGGAELNYKISEHSNLLFRFESTPYYYQPDYYRTRGDRLMFGPLD